MNGEFRFGSYPAPSGDRQADPQSNGSYMGFRYEGRGHAWQQRHVRGKGKVNRAVS